MNKFSNSKTVLIKDYKRIRSWNCDLRCPICGRYIKFSNKKSYHTEYVYNIIDFCEESVYTHKICEYKSFLQKRRLEKLYELMEKYKNES